MKFPIRRCAFLLVCAGLFTPAVPQGAPTSGTPQDQRLPNGKSQNDEILKAEHTANLKDADELSQLVEQLKIDLEKNDRHVLSMATLKKTDDIEKIARRIRSRLRHN